jgi:amidase
MKHHISRRTFLSNSAIFIGSAFLPFSLKKNTDLAFQDPGVKPDSLTFASAVEAAAAIRRGETSSVELTKHILRRIEKHNPVLNAVVTLIEDEALARARQADDAASRGKWWGAFHGVPITVKDTFELAGVRTTAGAPFLSEYIPKEDAATVARLKAAGAVILGHSNVPLMAGDWQSYNEIFGATNNPWDLKRTPGGSTGGGAAALAAGLSYFSIGSDIGGSIRIPAHFCGVYGHKPTLNLVPSRGHIPPPPGGPPSPPMDLAVAGPLARSAPDLKMAIKVLGGPDREEAIAYNWSLPPARQARLSEYRLGCVIDDPLCPLSSDVKEVIVNAIKALSSVNPRIEEGWPSNIKPAEQYDTYRYLLAATFAFELQDNMVKSMRNQAAKTDNSFETISARALIQPHKHFQAASSGRMAARAAWQEYFKTHDAFLIPTAFVPAFPHDRSPVQNLRKLQTPEGKRDYYDLMFWISFATLAGLPATTAPLGFTKEGLPVGLQIVGPYLEDATPIDIAEKLADVIGGFQAPREFS